MRRATSVTLQPRQILHLPRKITRMLNPRRIWHVVYNARSNKIDHPTSPNTAPATQNESKHWSAWHMKRHLLCAEQAKSPSNLTKYCPCHEILKLKISAETPNRKSSSRTRRCGDLTRPIVETHFLRKNTTLPRKVTLQPHQILRLPRKINLSTLIRLTYETPFTMRGASKVTLQPHQVLHLPLKLKISAETPWSASSKRKTIRG